MRELRTWTREEEKQSDRSNSYKLRFHEHARHSVREFTGVKLRIVNVWSEIQSRVPRNMSTGANTHDGNAFLSLGETMVGEGRKETRNFD